MKKSLLFATLLTGAMSAQAVIHTVTTSGFTFSPATTNANVGDTIRFVIGGGHTATEVSLSTWSANGTTPLGGGFNFSPGTHDVKMTATGTRYYVCTVHVGSMGMKGQINVSGGSGIDEQNKEISMSLYPNPAIDFVQLNVSGSDNNAVNIEVINLLGNKVLDLGGKQTLVNGAKKIDISGLPRGVYFLNVVTDNKNRSIRFVKQ